MGKETTVLLVRVCKTSSGSDSDCAILIRYTIHDTEVPVRLESMEIMGSEFNHDACQGTSGDESWHWRGDIVRYRYPAGIHGFMNVQGAGSVKRTICMSMRLCEGDSESSMDAFPLLCSVLRKL